MEKNVAAKQEGTEKQKIVFLNGDEENIVADNNKFGTIYVIDLTPECGKKLATAHTSHSVIATKDQKENEAKDNALFLFAKLLGPTAHGPLAVGLETRVAKRSSETSIDGLFQGEPLRWRVKVHGNDEFEADFFGTKKFDQFHTFCSITVKMLFSNIPRLLNIWSKDQSDQAKRAPVIEYTKGGIPMFLVGCVNCRHPLWLDRYVLGTSNGTTATVCAYRESMIMMGEPKKFRGVLDEIIEKDDSPIDSEGKTIVTENEQQQSATEEKQEVLYACGSSSGTKHEIDSSRDNITTSSADTTTTTIADIKSATETSTSEKKKPLECKFVKDTMEIFTDELESLLSLLDPSVIGNGTVS